MFNYNPQEVDCELSNELRMNRIGPTLPLSPQRVAQKRYFAVFKNKTHSVDKTLLQSFFLLKLSDKALILPLMSTSPLRFMLHV